MDEPTRATQKPVLGIGDVPRELGHSRPIRVGAESRDVHAARGQLDQHEHGEPRQAARQLHLHHEEIGGRQHVPVGGQELPPGRPFRPVGGGLQPMAPEHVGDGAASYVMTQIRECSRVDDWRGGGRRMGVAVPGGFRDAGASLPAMAPFPVAAHRTGRADFPQPALGRDHAFAHGKLVVRTARRVSPYSSQSRSSGNRTYCPERTLCLRQSHWRSRRVACRSIAA